MTKIVLNDVISGYNLSLIEDNFDKLATELQDKVLYRNNPTGEPNAMQHDIDMNGFSLINANKVNAQEIYIGGIALQDFIEGVAAGTIDPVLVDMRRFTFTNSVGGTTQLTLVRPHSGNEEQLLVSRNGVVQDINQYTVIDPTTISFSLPLEIGEIVEIIYFNTVVGLEGPEGPEGPPGPIGPAGVQGPAGAGVPVGGATGQVLTKASNTDNDTYWEDVPVQTAAQVPFTPVANLAATDVQAAIAEEISDLAASSGSNLLGFLQSGTGASARTAQAKFRDWVNVKDFGALGDGVTDDTAAFNAALLAHKRVYVPAGTYSLAGTINMTQSGNVLSGAGRFSTILLCTTNNLPAITVSASLNNVWVSDMSINRTPTAIAGAYGINCPSITNFSRFFNLYLENHYNGLRLGPTGFSSIDHVTVNKSQQDGVTITNAAGAGGGACQWTIINTLVQFSVGRGFFVSGLGAASQPVALGEWLSVATFANSGLGIAVVGQASSPIHGFRLTNSFIGADGNSEVFLDTYGTVHKIVGNFMELPGQTTTGPTNSTPASGIGSGINISANNGDVLISGNRINGCSNSGISTSCTRVQIVGNSISNCGVSGVQPYGILLLAGSGTISGNFCGNISGVFQTHGLFFNADLNFTVTGNDFSNNTTRDINISASITKAIFTHNLPQKDGWVVFTGTTGAITKRNGVASVVRNLPGNYTVTLATALPDTSYLVEVNVRSANDANSWSGFETLASAHTTTAFTVGTTQTTAAGATTFADPTTVYVRFSSL